MNLMKHISYNFYWITSDNRALSIQDMETDYLINCLKMIYNHTLPKEYRFPNYKKYTTLNKSKTYLKMALTCITFELGEREDLTDKHKADLQFMRDKINGYNRDKALSSGSDNGIMELLDN